VLVLGTGGWSFAVQALLELPGSAPAPASGVPLGVLDYLDPDVVDRVVRNRPRPWAGFLAVSGSGSTLETRCLADLASRQVPSSPLVWLSDRARPPSTLALSASGSPDQVALLGAPLSIGFLAPAALADPGGLAAAYLDLRRDHRELGREAAERAISTAVRTAVGTQNTGSPTMSIWLPPWAGPGLRRWLLQLGRQVLGGKSAGFRPWVEVGHPHEGGDQGPDLDLRSAEPDLTGLIRLMYSAGIFAACLALRAGLRPVEHPNVDAYKALIGDPIRTDAIRSDRIACDPADLPTRAATWLRSRPELTRLHVVHYGGPRSASTDPSGYATVTGRRVEVHSGTAWNHHTYQAVHADPASAVLVVVGPARARGIAPGDPALARAEQMLHRIAEATHVSLPGRSLLVRLTTETRQSAPTNDNGTVRGV
jgi:hypothetical protein